MSGLQSSEPPEDILAHPIGLDLPSSGYPPIDMNAASEAGTVVFLVALASFSTASLGSVAACGGGSSSSMTELCSGNRVSRQGLCCLPSETEVIENERFHPNGECCEEGDVVSFGEKCCDEDGDECCTQSNGVRVCKSDPP